MAKKAISIPTRPLEAQQDDFVSRKPEKSAEPMVRMSIDLPQSKHTTLKIICATDRIRMADRVRELIDQFIASRRQKADAA